MPDPDVAVLGREALGLRMAVNHLTRVVGPVIFGFVGSSYGTQYSDTNPTSDISQTPPTQAAASRRFARCAG